MQLTRRDFVRVAAGATALAGTTGLGGLAAACTAAQPPPARPLEKDLSQLYAAARREGWVVWWTASTGQAAAEAIAAAFQQKYPGLEVQLLQQAGQVLNARLLQDLKAGANTCDVFCSGDEAHYPPLKKANALAAYRLPDLGLIPRSLQEIDPDGAYHVAALAFMIVDYRRDQVHPPPRSWSDLLGSAWNGKLTTGHPAFSALAGSWAVAMLQRYGDQYLKDLGQLNPKVNASADDTVQDLLNGERQLGAGPDAASLAARAAGAAVELAFPTDEATLVIRPAGILARSDRPSAARLFANFMCSKEYSEALVATFNQPLRPDVAGAGGVPALDRIKYRRHPVEQLTAALPEAVAKWRQYVGA